MEIADWLVEFKWEWISDGITHTCTAVQLPWELHEVTMELNIRVLETYESRRMILDSGLICLSLPKFSAKLSSSSTSPSTICRKQRSIISALSVAD